MMKQQVSEQASITIEGKRIILKGEISKGTIPLLWETTEQLKDFSSAEYVDLREVISVDSAGVMYIQELAAKIKSYNPAVADKNLFDLVKNHTDSIKHSLNIFSQENLQDFSIPKPAGF